MPKSGRTQTAVRVTANASDFNWSDLKSNSNGNEYYKTKVGQLPVRVIQSEDGWSVETRLEGNLTLGYNTGDSMYDYESLTGFKTSAEAKSAFADWLNSASPDKERVAMELDSRDFRIGEIPVDVLIPKKYGGEL